MGWKDKSELLNEAQQMLFRRSKLVGTPYKTRPTKGVAHMWKVFRPRVERAKLARNFVTARQMLARSALSELERVQRHDLYGKEENRIRGIYAEAHLHMKRLIKDFIRKDIEHVPLIGDAVTKAVSSGSVRTRGATREDIYQALGMSPRRGSAVIRRLTNKGILKKHANGGFVFTTEGYEIINTLRRPAFAAASFVDILKADASSL